jgi:hypothetical protein
LGRDDLYKNKDFLNGVLRSRNPNLIDLATRQLETRYSRQVLSAPDKYHDAVNGWLYKRDRNGTIKDYRDAARLAEEMGNPFLTNWINNAAKMENAPQSVKDLAVALAKNTNQYDGIYRENTGKLLSASLHRVIANGGPGISDNQNLTDDDKKAAAAQARRLFEEVVASDRKRLPLKSVPFSDALQDYLRDTSAGAPQMLRTTARLLEIAKAEPEGFGLSLLDHLSSAMERQTGDNLTVLKETFGQLFRSIEAHATAMPNNASKDSLISNLRNFARLNKMAEAEKRLTEKLKELREHPAD